jgi:integrase
MAAFLQTLKETGARSGEAWRIEWNDIDIENRKINISKPEIGCNARLLRITPKLLNMLSALP